MITQANKESVTQPNQTSATNDVAILLDLDNLVIGAKQVNLTFNINIALEYIKQLTNGRIVLRNSYGDWRARSTAYAGACYGGLHHPISHSPQ